MQNQLEPWLFETILKDTYNTFKAEEVARIRKEEDEKSWEAARKFRTYSLRVTYFYRWLNIFRKQRVIKRIQETKERARQWRLPENVAKREREESVARKEKGQEVMDLLRRSAQGKAEEKRRRESVQSAEASIEEVSLLATGHSNGLPDARELAQAKVNSASNEARHGPPSAATMLRIENERRRRRGLLPLKRPLQPPVYKEGSKSAKLKALCDGGDALSMSTGSFRNSTFSSSYRSSLGVNNNRVSKPRPSRVSDPYWKLKANGLVQMPNGEYLHESLALPMLREGKRFAGLGDYGLPPAASATPSMSPPPIRADLLNYSPTSDLNINSNIRSRVSRSPSVASLSGIRRKRPRVDQAEEIDEDLAAYRSETSATGRKRARSGESAGSDQDFLARMDSLLADIESENKK
jgi:nuclear mRNA export protein SAC3